MLAGDPAVPTHGSDVDTATSLAPQTASTWRQAVGSGSRPMYRPRRSTQKSTRGLVTTKCFVPILQPVIRRFLVGPKQCEITGVFTTANERTNVCRHPAPWGETPDDSPTNPANPKALSRRGPTALPADARAQPARDHQGRRRTDRQLTLSRRTSRQDSERLCAVRRANQT